MYVSDVVIILICEYVLINYTIVRIFDFTRQRTDTSHIPGGLVRSIRANSQPCMWFSLPYPQPSPLTRIFRPQAFPCSLDITSERIASVHDGCEMGKGANASVVRNSPQLNDQSSGRKYTQIHGQVRPKLNHDLRL